MYNMWLSIFAIVLGVIGTIKTILSILKMRLKDVIFQRTALGLDTQELTTLQQVYDARVGIVLVILSGALQVFEKLYGEMNCNVFYIVIVITVIIVVIWWISMFYIYKKDKLKLIDDMPQEIKNSLYKIENNL